MFKREELIAAKFERVFGIIIRYESPHYRWQLESNTKGASLVFYVALGDAVEQLVKEAKPSVKELPGWLKPVPVVPPLVVPNCTELETELARLRTRVERLEDALKEIGKQVEVWPDEVHLILEALVKEALEGKD